MKNAKENCENDRVTIRLPIPLPTWNVILAMNEWKRKRLRDLLHRFLFVFTPSAGASLTQTEYRQKQLLMASDIAAYYKMIRPRRSAKSAILKDTGKAKKR